MEITNFIHPSIAFIIAALLIPFIPKKYKWASALLLIPALIAVHAAFTNGIGEFAKISWLGQEMILGRADRLSNIFVQVFAIMALAGLIFSMHITDRWQQMAALFYVAGGFGCVLAGDYLSLFLFWEIMSLGSTVLIFLNRSRESIGAAFRYFLFHTFGALLLLGGLVLRYKATGNFDFVASGTNNVYDYLILLGFCVNAAVVPLHAWLPDAYPRASVTGAVFMCAFTTKTAVYVLARAYGGWEILAIMGTIMAIYGVVYASMENNARRILSYHIVSQVGYMVAGIGVGTALTLNGAVAHAYAHILYKGLLFMSAGVVLYSAGTAKLDELGGLASRMPIVMLFYMIAALSISGMPLFNGFISKNMTISGAAEAHYFWVALGLEVAAVGTFISVGLKLPYFAFWGGKAPDLNRKLKKIPANMYVGMFVLGALCILQGIFPNLLYKYLPNQEAISLFQPWTVWGVLQALLILGFSGLAFYLMRNVIRPHKALNLDFDYVYRIIGRFVLAVICKPLAFLDNIWGQVYKKVALFFMMLLAKITVFFDKYIIDGVVDGTAHGVRGVGRLGALSQNSKLQDYLAFMIIIVVAIIAVIWYLI